MGQNNLINGVDIINKSIQGIFPDEFYKVKKGTMSHILRFTENQECILNWFFENKDTGIFNAAQIERDTEISNSSIINSWNRLRDIGIISVSEFDRTVLYYNYQFHENMPITVYDRHNQIIYPKSRSTLETWFNSLPKSRQANILRAAVTLAEEDQKTNMITTTIINEMIAKIFAEITYDKTC